MKKYYGYFVYDDKEYVIRFKIRGLKYKAKDKCFEDRDWYVRSIGDVIAMAAIDTHPINDKRFGFSMLLTQKQYAVMRSLGVKKWTPKRKIINWTR